MCEVLHFVRTTYNSFSKLYKKLKYATCEIPHATLKRVETLIPTINAYIYIFYFMLIIYIYVIINLNAKQLLFYIFVTQNLYYHNQVKANLFVYF